MNKDERAGDWKEDRSGNERRSRSQVQMELFDQFEFQE